MVSIIGALKRIKSRLFGAVEALRRPVIERVCEELGYEWRGGPLDPANTVALFVRQVAEGNVSCEQVRHLARQVVEEGEAIPRFTGSAYCQARQRLPLKVLQGLSDRVRDAIVEGTAADEAYRWRGLRGHVLDCSTFSMPDTKELREHFGLPSGQEEGCGFPVAHLLALFDVKTGAWECDVVMPLRTGDVSHAADAHPLMGEGDLALGDDAFSTYAHFGLLSLRKMHGLFPNHHRRIVDFTPNRPHLKPGEATDEQTKGLPRSKWVKSLGVDDQLVEWLKPKDRPRWMTKEQYAALPESLTVREVRRTVRRKGFRPVTVTVVTTLLDPEKYPADELVTLRMGRWCVETDLGHLKTTMGMDVLRSETVEGVKKEMTVFKIVYNLVRVVMIEAARRQGVAADRISFADALAWVRHAEPEDELPNLVVVPYRPDRAEPRAVKRRPKQFDLLNKPREELRKAIREKARSV